MADGDPYKRQAQLGDGGEVVIDGSQSSTGAVDVTELGGTAGADVVREVDDGSITVGTVIDQPTNNWHSQKNVFVVSQSSNISLKITNTSGGSASYFIIGYEVPDGA